MFQMDQYCAAFFPGLPLLLAFTWILIYILDIFVAEETKLQQLELKETTDSSIAELKLSNEDGQVVLKVAEKKVQSIEDILLERTQAAESLVDEQSATLTEAINFLQLAVEVPPKTWMKLLEHTGFLIQEKANNLKSKADVIFHNKPKKVFASEQEYNLVKAMKEAATLRTERALYKDRSQEFEAVAGESNRQLLALKETSANDVKELEASIETGRAALKISKDEVQILEEVILKTTQEAETLKTEMSAAIAEQKSLLKERTKQYEFMAEEINRELQELKETSTKEIMELRALNETFKTEEKVADEKKRILEEMLANAIKEAEVLKSEPVKRLEFMVHEAKQKLLELKESTDRSIAELKLSNEDGQVALKVAEKKVQSIEDILLERTQAAESLSDEQAAALTEATDFLQLAIEVPPKTWMKLLERTGFSIEEKANNLKSKADILFHNKPSDTKTGST